jgi:acyl carrier protein
VLTDSDLLDHVKTSIVTALGTQADELAPETRLFEDLGVDSVDLLDISYELERLTGCELELTELFRRQDAQPGRDLTVSQLAGIIKTRLAGAEGR